MRVLGTVSVGLQLILQAELLPEIELPRVLQAVILVQQVAVVKALETVSTLGFPLILQVAFVPEVGPLLALQVVIWMKRVAVLRVLPTVSVWLQLILQAVMMPEIEFPLGLQIVMRPQQVAVWELYLGWSIGIPGFEFSEVQGQWVTRPSLPSHC